MEDFDQEQLTTLVASTQSIMSTLLIPLHISYIQSLASNKDDLSYHMSSHLRMNAIYWGLMACVIMKQPNALDKVEMVEWVMSCWDDEVGMGLDDVAY